MGQRDKVYVYGYILTYYRIVVGDGLGNYRIYTDREGVGGTVSTKLWARTGNCEGVGNYLYVVGGAYQDVCQGGRTAVGVARNTARARTGPAEDRPPLHRR